VLEFCIADTHNADDWAVNYFENRQMYTYPLASDLAWAGISAQLGGTINELYSKDRSLNLLDEHAGAMMQLSIWHSGAYNPIQAIGPYGYPWKPVNDGYYNGPSGQAYALNSGPHNFAWPFQAFTGLYFQQWAQNMGDHIQATYKITNNTGLNGSVHDQELPAIHLNDKIDTYLAFRDPSGMLQEYTRTESAAFYRLHRVPAPRAYSPSENPKPWDGRWMSQCDTARLYCVTVASPCATQAFVTQRALTPVGKPYSALTPMTFQTWPNGLVQQWDVWVFPYRWDVSPTGPGGPTVEQRINAVVPTTSRYLVRESAPFLRARRR
jgi:hypothetical protein